MVNSNCGCKRKTENRSLPRFQPSLRFQQYLWRGSDPSSSPGQFARSRAHPVLQRKLGTPHIGPSCSGGVPARSDRDPIPEKVPSQGSVEGQYGIHDLGGGREPVQETSNKSSSGTE